MFFLKIKPGGNLRITHLQKSDSGLYVCVANNTVGIRRSTAAELRVQGIYCSMLKCSISLSLFFGNNCTPEL